MSGSVETRKLPAYLAAAGMVLLVLFVLVIPIYLDMQGAPKNHNGMSGPTVAIAAWPLWPDNLNKLTRSRAPVDVETFYEQMAHFSNQSAYPMSMLERTIADFKKGHATGNDIYEAARAVSHAVDDERDALMGLVLPPRLRADLHVQEAWRSAQLASIAKHKALGYLLDAPARPGNLAQEKNGSKHLASWEQPEYLNDLREAREQTTDALNSMMLSASEPSIGR